MSGEATDLGAMKAVIFDLDGVVTPTAEVHAQAWKQLFDEYLAAWARKLGEPFRPFDRASDYLRFVDGKPRYEGVASFLASRGIELPFGSPRDPGGAGDRLVDLHVEELSDPGGLEHGPAVAARRDGLDAAELGLPGKPDPGVFLDAARRLSVEPAHAAVVEDAIAGVEAGRRGGFGLVVGVDRGAQFDALAAAGADVVVSDLGELAL